MTEAELRRELALAFEYSYRHDDWVTPLDEALEGLTAETARWSPRSDVLSVWAIVLHLAAWHEDIVERVRTRARQHPAEGAWPPLPQAADEAAWTAAKARLDASLEAVRAMIEVTPLDVIQAGPYGLADLICRFTHNGYHLGQITKLREWMGDDPSSGAMGAGR